LIRDERVSVGEHSNAVVERQRWSDCSTRASLHPSPVCTYVMRSCLLLTEM